MNRRALWLACTALTVVAAQTAHAQTVWDGSTSTDWFTAGNWSTNTVPVAGNTAIIETTAPNPTVISGGLAEVATGWIGNAAATTGEVTVTGPGVRWTVTNSFRVGGSGAGTLIIQNGGRMWVPLGAPIVQVGIDPGSTGTVNVTGAGSRWDADRGAVIGVAGNGELIVSNGGQAVFTDYTDIAATTGSTGRATVDGAGSRMSVPAIFTLRVGVGGNGTMNVLNGGFAGSFRAIVGAGPGSTGTVTVNGAGSTWNSGDHLTLGLAGTATLTVQNGGLVLAENIVIADEAAAAGTVNIGAAAGAAAAAPGRVLGRVSFFRGTGQMVFNHTATNYTFEAPIEGIVGAGNLLFQAGTTNLTAISPFSGTTTVNSGTLRVNGSIGNSTTTVNAGGTLGGSGFVGNTTINGGTLAPGNSIGTLTVQGNLVFAAASTYLIEVDPNASDRTNVTGTATLGGATVSASYAPGSYVTKRYTILNATGGVIGTFSALANTNLPASFAASLGYDPNNVYLDLNMTALNFGPGLNGNQTNVANALVNSFDTAGGIPLAFGALTAQGLTQVSGEAATGTQQTTFDAMDNFMNVMTDPFMGERGMGAPPTGPTGYADDDEALSYASKRKGRTTVEREAYAKTAVKALPRATAFAQRWSVWGAGYGGTQSTDGNATVGSNDYTARIYGGAAGFDYRLTPETLIGFALGGAGTTYGLANGLGGGRSEMFQAGVYGRHTFGRAYISAALAYGWQDVTTDRNVLLSQLRANFDANAISGRLEAGYRFATGMGGLTPYAAGQFSTFFLPAYAEQVVAGSNLFALAYAEKDVTASRSELGLRGDTSFALADAVVTLRGRAAWAHNFNTDRSISAIFQTLPASGFVVNGASPARGAALVSAGAEARWLNGISVAASFEGEFSHLTDSYAGKGVVRYQW